MHLMNTVVKHHLGWQMALCVVALRCHGVHSRRDALDAQRAICPAVGPMHATLQESSDRVEVGGGETTKWGRAHDA